MSVTDAGMVTDLMESQFINAPAPMDVIPSWRVMLSRAPHSINAEFGIAVIAEESSTFLRLLHLLNALSPNVKRVSGSFISVRPSQS